MSSASSGREAAVHEELKKKREGTTEPYPSYAWNGPPFGIKLDPTLEQKTKLIIFTILSRISLGHSAGTGI